MRFCEPAPRLIFTAPTDAMFFIFEIALTCGTVLASPVLFWQAWQFIAPGLYRKEKAVAALMVAA